MTFLLQANSYNKFRFHLYKVIKYFQAAIKMPEKDVGRPSDSPVIRFSQSRAMVYHNLSTD